jgi:hypothetical protein
MLNAIFFFILNLNYKYKTDETLILLLFYPYNPINLVNLIKKFFLFLKFIIFLIFIEVTILNYGFQSAQSVY